MGEWWWWNESGVKKDEDKAGKQGIREGWMEVDELLRYPLATASVQSRSTMKMSPSKWVNSI